MTQKVKTRTRSILRLFLALVLLTVMITMTRQQATQADDDPAVVQNLNGPADYRSATEGEVETGR